ncbi:MAG: biopolymer transporter ExbD [Planctomycetota bacterium]
MADAERTTADAADRLRAARAVRRRPPLRLQPPLTPMIDVTFQLLLFFLLTMRFTPPEGQLPADLPRLESSTAAVAPLEPVRVRLERTEAGLRIDLSRYHLAVDSFGALHETLVELRERFGSGDPPVVIVPGDGVTWADALNAYNEARRAAFVNVAFGRRVERP